MNDAPTPLTAAEIASMNATAEAIRRSFADPLFATRPDLQAAAETSIAVARLRSGTTEPDQSPQTLVERQHAAAWSYAMPPGLRDQLDAMRADIEARGQVVEETAALKEHLGAAEYGRLADEVRAAVPDAPLATYASEYLMRQLAAVGRYNRAARATAPKKP